MLKLRIPAIRKLELLGLLVSRTIILLLQEVLVFFSHFAAKLVLLPHELVMQAIKSRARILASLVVVLDLSGRNCALPLLRVLNNTTLFMHRSRIIVLLGVQRRRWVLFLLVLLL